MAPSRDPRTSRGRVGRRRLPPMAPGPDFQFVVANHPNDFRDGRVMRSVRSHVMYKQRENRGSSPSDAARSRQGSTPSSLPHTPSPTANDADDLWQNNDRFTPTRNHGIIWDQDGYSFHAPSPPVDPLRTLAAQILSATNTTLSSSAPPRSHDNFEYSLATTNIAGHESLEDLKRAWVHNTTFFCHDIYWMRYVCDNRLSFLSHVHATLVYQDLAEGRLYDSDLTVYAKTKILRMIGGGLNTSDVTIISIIHLLVGSIGGMDQDVFDVHRDGLATCIRNQHGGLSPNIAIFMTLVMLTLAVSRGQIASDELTPRRPSQVLADENGPISPLSAPLEYTLIPNGMVSSATCNIIQEIQKCTHILLTRSNRIGNMHPMSSGRLAYDAQLQTIYSSLLSLPSASQDDTTDWIYESCRLAALIYTRSIIHGATLAHLAHHLSSEPTTLLTALHTALGHTDTQRCWGTHLSGVFLWVCLVGAAASARMHTRDPSHSSSSSSSTSPSSSSLIWMHKCFALYAVRAAVSVPFDHADGTIRALRVMLRVQRESMTA